ncbi:UNVERIFIED_CONTAM: Guanine nucleotide-binding protein-like NSN1 [Sesamum latifolium]|uniref:Guanine nucleotide-binding protein-like NSN1 n=1 Tax=Sesamum latifolium TaxID=2727402 RepID=A0AAW2Y5G2_9LAMI
MFDFPLFLSIVSDICGANFLRESKRVPLRKKYKIIRKEHHKKKAKLGFNKKPKVEKDPGIPNDWPFKEQELKALEARRQRAIQELEEKKAARKERAQKKGLLEDEEVDKQSSVGDEQITGNSTGTNRKWDNSEKTFYKELVKVIEASDVILEVLDARDPLDLVPREAVEKWLKYLREELPTVAFNAAHKNRSQTLGGNLLQRLVMLESQNNLLQTSDCLGAETLIKLLKNYSRSHEIKKSITVGIIGLPNVGKSSVINSLKRSHVVNRIEKLDDPVGPVKDILKLCPERVLVTLYKVPTFDSVDDFLQKVATVRGKLKKGGIVDVDAAARIVLHDWNEGIVGIRKSVLLRNAEEPSEAKIVTELGKEFNVDEVYGGESSFIGSLKSVNDFNPVEVPSNCPLNFDMMALEEDAAPQSPTQGDDQLMESEEENTVVKEKSASSRQNEKLYVEEGMLNAKVRKAEKRRRKKENQSSGMDHDADEDYHFKVDYIRKESAMDTGDQDGMADEKNKNRFELPSGVELDNE